MSKIPPHRTRSRPARGAAARTPAVDEAAFDTTPVAIDENHTSAVPTTTAVHHAWLEEVSSASTRGLSIIDDLLWLGRQNDHENRVSDLGMVFPQIEPLLRRLVRKDITFRMEIPPTDTIVRIDRVGLTQVLMNLVTNASDAIESKGSITVSSRQTLTATPGDPTRTTSIVVSDTGCGFSQEAMERAFEPDFTTKDGDHGGYGLATVSQIVDRCGGAVQIDSSPGAGTTVSIRFGCRGAGRISRRTGGSHGSGPTTGTGARRRSDGRIGDLTLRRRLRRDFGGPVLRNPDANDDLARRRAGSRGVVWSERQRDVWPSPWAVLDRQHGTHEPRPEQ